MAQKKKTTEATKKEKPAKPEGWKWFQTRDRDRSKKFLYTAGEISDKNVLIPDPDIKALRPRKQVDYTAIHVTNEKLEMEGNYSVRKTDKSKAKNKRDPVKRESVKKKKTKSNEKESKVKIVSLSAKEKKKVIDRLRRNDKKENLQKPRRKKVEKKTEEKVDEDATMTEANESKEVKKISKKCITLIEKLGAETKEDDSYTYKGKSLPSELAFFMNVVWPKDVHFRNDKLSVRMCKFEPFSLTKKEFVQFPFFKEHSEKVVLFGNATGCMVCTLTDCEDKEDFDVYIVDDDHNEKIDGPYKLSKFLNNLKEDDGKGLDDTDVNTEDKPEN